MYIYNTYVKYNYRKGHIMNFINPPHLQVLGSYSTQTTSLARTATMVTAVVICLSVASSVFSTFKLTAFIPLVLAVSGAVTSWTAYLQTDLRLVQTNNALNQLQQVRERKKVFSSSDNLFVMSDTEMINS